MFLIIHSLPPVQYPLDRGRAQAKLFGQRLHHVLAGVLAGLGLVGVTGLESVFELLVALGRVGGAGVGFSGHAIN